MHRARLRGPGECLFSLPRAAAWQRRTAHRQRHYSGAIDGGLAGGLAGGGLSCGGPADGGAAAGAAVGRAAELPTSPGPNCKRARRTQLSEAQACARSGAAARA